MDLNIQMNVTMKIGKKELVISYLLQFMAINLNLKMIDNYNENQLKILTDKHFNEKSLEPFPVLSRLGAPRFVA